LPSDTLLAIKVMQTQVRESSLDAEEYICPGVLKTQVYTMIKDRSLVDKELEKLKKSNQIRMFQSPSASTDIIILLYEDYLDAINREKEIFKNKKNTKKEDLNLIDDFINNVLPNYSGMEVDKKQLESLFKNRTLTDFDVNFLFNFGLLNNKTPGIFYMSVPGIGFLCSQIVEGRKSIESGLRRSKWKEKLLKYLNEKKIRKSKLRTIFHIKDLLGQDKIECIETTEGTLVRLKK